MTAKVQVETRRELIRMAWMLTMSLLSPAIGIGFLSFWTGQSLRWTTFLLVLIPIAGLLIWDSVRRIQNRSSAQAARQFGLGSLLTLVSVSAVWLTVARADWVSQHQQSLLRQQVEQQMQKLVGKGRVQLSTDSLFVQVERPDFNDESLRALVAEGRSSGDLPFHFYLLDLSGTQVTDEGLAALSECAGLEFLCLDGTQVTGAGLQVIRQMPDLQLLSRSRACPQARGVARRTFIRPNERSCGGFFHAT
jgi:hypothetical protein